MRMRKIQTENKNIEMGTGPSSAFFTAEENITNSALAAGYFGCITPTPERLVDRQKRNAILRKAAKAFQSNFVSAPFKDEAA